MIGGECDTDGISESAQIAFALSVALSHYEGKGVT